MKKVKLKKKNTKRLWSRNCHYSDSVFYHIERLRLIYITSQKISSAENQHFQNKWNTSTVTDRLFTHRTLVDKFAGYTERSHVQKTVHNTCAKVSLSQVDCTRDMESSDSDDSLSEPIFVWKTWVDGFNLVDWTSTLSLFLDIFANHFLVCLSSESVGSSSDRQDNKTFGNGR